jgi:hypothetical protein
VIRPEHDVRAVLCHIILEISAHGPRTNRRSLQPLRIGLAPFIRLNAAFLLGGRYIVSDGYIEGLNRVRNNWPVVDS